jgi:hypothetical protein
LGFAQRTWRRENRAGITDSPRTRQMADDATGGVEAPGLVRAPEIFGALALLLKIAHGTAFQEEVRCPLRRLWKIVTSVRLSERDASEMGAVLPADWVH